MMVPCAVNANLLLTALVCTERLQPFEAICTDCEFHTSVADAQQAQYGSRQHDVHAHDDAI